MSKSITTLFETFKKKNKLSLLTHAKQGLERELMRATANGEVAKTPHPKALGSVLTHPYITLDFAQAQIEFTTPPLKNEEKLFDFLEKLSSWTARQLGSELMWPQSMPPKLPKHTNIELANFGASSTAQKKHIYREGLKQRYGGAMQTISGIHYNFSMDDDFWQAYANLQNSKLPLHAFKDSAYFALMRNIIRFVPLYTYLFGFSPALDASYLTKPSSKLRQLDATTYYGPHATSLRLSTFGYHNEHKNTGSISYNSITDYLNDLYQAISTPSKLWSELGVFKNKKQIQLNANMLQLENEFYTSVRPKQKKHQHPNSVICSLACAGVEYVEFRSVDVNPFEPTGIALEQLYFLHTFVLTCLLEPSPLFKSGEQALWEENNRSVALYGRKPGLTVYNGSKQTNFIAWAKQVLGTMEQTAYMLDKATETKKYSEVVTDQFKKLLDSNLTPSAQILKMMQESKKSFTSFGSTLALINKKKQAKQKLDAQYNRTMRALTEKSISDQIQRETLDAWILQGYEFLELSTQIIIREAIKRGINVRVIDAPLNVIELSHRAKKEIVKQATITRRDTFLSYELMNNKQLTKTFLAQAGIRVPAGSSYSTIALALKDANAYEGQVAIKPTATNYGTGVSIVNARNAGAYAQAVRKAFSFDSTIIVEEFIAGKEFRFLVIGGNIVGVLNREPANVVGDGKHTIAQLVEIKNTNPSSYKLPDKYIKLGIEEKEMLAEQNLKITSIPAKGKKIYVRKNSNVSMGGDPLDATDSVHTDYKDIALVAASSVGANICGVDMIILDATKPATQKNYGIIELNWNPAIFMHQYPIEGKPRNVGKAVLDFLGF